MAKEHGDTRCPLKIEHRRNRLSAQIILIDRCIKQIQDVKKTLPAQMAEQIDIFTKTREKQEAMLDPATRAAFKSETKQKLMELQSAAEQQVLAYEITIAQLTASMAQIEAGCLIVDCLSIRRKGKSPLTGKKGACRWTAAGYLHDIGLATLDTLSLYEQVFKKQVGEGDGKDEDEDEVEVDDEEIMSEDERKKHEAEQGKYDDGPDEL